MKKITIALLLFFATWGVKSQEVKTVEQANGLKVGHKAPAFSAMDADSNVFHLKEALQNGPVVIIFQRSVDIYIYLYSIKTMCLWNYIEGKTF